LKSSVLVLGGYGLFGKRVCDLLLRNCDCEIVIAGRNLSQAKACCDGQDEPGRTHAIAVDSQSPSLVEELKFIRSQFNTKVLIHCAGPFQGQSYAVARAAIDAGLHYIDLADGREFVSGITMLDAAAKAAGVAIISGASSVPALSSAVVEQLAEHWTEVHSIDIGISPGNQTERGIATMRAILSYCGARIPGWEGGMQIHRFGWQGMRASRYRMPAGKRWLVDCDEAAVALLPTRDILAVLRGLHIRYE
jgi:saccharopine dehydrogenase-like NADP-dependent oxidoreductase